MTTFREKYKREAILYAGIFGNAAEEEQGFVSGKDYLPVSGKVFGSSEMKNAVEAVLDGWWTEGRWTKQFEKQLKEFLFMSGDVVMVNSGSSANLLALAALKEMHDLPDGGEIITSALAFPTTVNPILQLGFKPHFVDVDVEMGTFVPTWRNIQDAINDKTVAIMMAHTLGNPWPVELFYRDYPVIEDNCDALGSSILCNKSQIKKTGTIGDFGTQSFYPAHHITAGEGGAVICKTVEGAKVVRSLRDWGRSCWCPTGKSDTCGKRFEQNFPRLPAGYDHKYAYSRIGWNMKSTDLNAAIGVAQMDRLDGFLEKRQSNFNLLDKLIIESGLGKTYRLPEARKNTAPAWFGYPLTIKIFPKHFSATEITSLLEKEYKIGTRRIFGGNILRQPAYKDIEYESADLPYSNLITHNSFWLGIWPGLSTDNIKYIAQSLLDATRKLKGGRL